MVKSPKWPVANPSKPIDLGLERVFEALEKLGNPQSNLPPVIHVAGTNGKGSTIAFLKSILESAGKKCHVYTSPHLIEFNERIIIAGKEISDTDLDEIIEETRSKCAGTDLTFFEGTTVAALLAFSRTKADYVLLETGLGGRLDATNVIEKPLLTIITPVSHDHMEFLGESIAQIAAEKAGIIKHGIDCIVAEQNKSALKVIREIAAEKNAKIEYVNEDFFYQPNTDGSFIYRDELGGTGFPKPSLRGKHQIMNAVVAVRAAIKMGIDKKHIKNGIKAAEWRARLQKITDNLLIDGGHNPEAAATISAFILEEDAKRKRHNIAIVGMLKTKDIKRFIENISPAFAEVFAVKIPGEENSYEPGDIKQACEDADTKCRIYADFDDAYANACNGQAALNNRVVICGSLYLAGHALGKIIK